MEARCEYSGELGARSFQGALKILVSIQRDSYCCWACQPYNEYPYPAQASSACSLQQQVSAISQKALWFTLSCLSLLSVSLPL